MGVTVNFDSVNRWLTLFANLGVMAGIIFLAIETQQNTVATQQSAATSFQAGFSEVELFMAGNQEFSEIIVKGRKGENVSEAEQLRLMVFYGTVLRAWQLNHLHYLSGTLDEDVWLGSRSYMAQILAEDIGLYNRWRYGKRHFSPGFNEMIESISGEARQD
jgi:hypothetical protein